MGPFFHTPDRSALLALGDITENTGTLHLCTGTQVKEIAQNVKIDSVHAGAECIGWLADWYAGAGGLWLGEQNRQGKLADTGVTDLLAVR